MADYSGIRKFKDAADYQKNLIIQSEIDRYIPGGRHFIDDALIQRIIAETDGVQPDPVRVREILAKSESTCETLLPEETAVLMQVTDPALFEEMRATADRIKRKVYDKLIERNLMQPTFVTRIPHEFVPLAKACKDDPSLVDVFEFVVAGRELCPGYTEQNDPLEQRKALEHQAGEDTKKIDEDFISALECGMPPTGGLGFGVDRLVMFLTGCDSIRDVVLFPQLKRA